MPEYVTDKCFGKYYVSMCVGLAMICGSQYFTYRNVRNLSLNNARLNVTIGVLNQTAQFGLVTKDFQSNMRGYLVTQDKALLSANYDNKMQLVEISDTLFNLIKTDSSQTRRVRELTAISSDIVAYSQHIASLYRTQGQEVAFNELKVGKGVILNQLLNRKINQIDSYEKNNLNQRRQLVASTQKNSILFILVTSFVGFSLTFLAIIFLNLDKRKQRQLQKEILEKERVLNQYLEAMPDGVMVVNTKKEIVLLNQSGREILGIKNGNLFALEDELKVIKLTDPMQSQARFTTETLPVARGLLGEKLLGNKIDLIKNDRIYHLETNVQPVLGLEGEITSAISVFRDITERANYEATLEKARTLAEKSVRVKDIFLSNVSHEIRTPLNAIIGFSNLLAYEVTDPKSAEYIGYIQFASKNLLELINDILDFSKIEAGQIHLEKTAVPLNELLDSISVIINQRADERGITYKSFLSNDLPATIETDKLRLTQILLNVCGNAVKFTQQGSVTLRVEPTGELINGIQNIRFEVRDTGIGIEKEKIEEVFNRFVQAAESTTRVFGGTGLGLSIVKSLVQLFDGTLNLTSEVGVGTVFTMVFPFRTMNYQQVTNQGESVMDVSTAIRSMHILAAEDNTLNQKLLRAIFERLKIPLTIVNNGLEAIERLEKEPFDLVLMDIQMPVMDGYTAIKKIRSSISRTIPIITMTAHAMVGEKEECLSIGANSYISKPFKESELMYTIAHLGNKENTKPALINEPVQNQHNSMSDSIVNMEYLAEITGGDNELRDELIALFENDSQLQLDLINQAAASGDLEKLRLSIHKFRSSLFSVGLLSTANEYKELEAILKQGRWETALNARLTDLKTDAEAGLTYLKTL